MASQSTKLGCNTTAKISGAAWNCQRPTTAPDTRRYQAVPAVIVEPDVYGTYVKRPVRSLASMSDVAQRGKVIATERGAVSGHNRFLCRQGAHIRRQLVSAVTRKACH